MPVSIVEAPGATIIDYDYIPDLIATLPEGIQKTLDVWGKEVEKSVRKVQSEQGGPGSRWSPKSDIAIEASGTDELMRGRTGALLQTLRMKQGKYPKERMVGWFDETHPDPGVLGDNRQAKRLTMAQLAAVQEFGAMAKGGRLPSTGLFPIVPRPWLSTAADAYGDDDMKEAALFLVDFINAYNVVHLPPNSYDALETPVIIDPIKSFEGYSVIE